MNRSYRVALLCWAIPLLAGIIVFIGWFFGGVEGWWQLGYFVIGAGSVLFVLGVIALALSIRKDRSTPNVSRRRLRTSSLLCAGLLLSNFPVALAMTGIVIRSEMRYTVVVQNDSALQLEDVQVFGGGIHSATVSVHPGGNARFDVWPSADGVLKLSARSASNDYEVVVEGYVTNMMGGDATVTFHADESFTVTHPER